MYRFYVSTLFVVGTRVLQGRECFKREENISRCCGDILTSLEGFKLQSMVLKFVLREIDGYIT